MRKFIFCILVLVFIISIFVVLNLNVTTQQCINYQCRSIVIPLYLKILDFFDRHYNYMQLTKSIIKDAKSDEERAMKILEWTYANLRRIPDGYPVIDDHIWYTIVRGYGADDQCQDVFTSLCNYANLNAFLSLVGNKDKNFRKPLSFVKIKNRWSLFDVYNGVYFKNREGKIASIEDLSVGNWRIVRLGEGIIPDDYAAYFNNLDPLTFKDWELLRPAIQSPIRRFIFWSKSKK